MSLRQDLEKALSLIPGKHKVNLHAIYADTKEQVDLDELAPRHFANWVEWAKEQGLGLDFNPTCFSHPKAADGFTLSHADEEIRSFWIKHCKASRSIAEHFGRELGQPCVTNFWVPDGYKDTPVDRLAPRMRLKESLDEIFSEEMDPQYTIDAVESKLFGIGSESYVVGSHEFYMGYGLTRGKAICLDAGHFHPTEVISNKLSSILMFSEQLLLHVSRPVRWDSDHVVTMDDEPAGDCPRAGSRGSAAAYAYRPRLLRRQYQSPGGLGNRHAQYDQGAAARYAGAGRGASCH